MFPLVTIDCWDCGMEINKTKPLLPRSGQMQRVYPFGRWNVIWTLTCFWMDISDGRWMSLTSDQWDPRLAGKNSETYTIKCINSGGYQGPHPVGQSRWRN